MFYVDFALFKENAGFYIYLIFLIFVGRCHSQSDKAASCSAAIVDLRTDVAGITLSSFNCF